MLVYESWSHGGRGSWESWNAKIWLLLLSAAPTEVGTQRFTKGNKADTSPMLSWGLFLYSHRPQETSLRVRRGTYGFTNVKTKKLDQKWSKSPQILAPKMNVRLVALSFPWCNAWSRRQLATGVPYVTAQSLGLGTDIGLWAAKGDNS